MNLPAGFSTHDAYGITAQHMAREPDISISSDIAFASTTLTSGIAGN